MNKKLIVDVEKIIYKSKKTSVNSSFEDLKKDIELLPKVLKVFERVNIETLKIDDNIFTIQLNDETVYLDNKFINLSSKVDFFSNQVVFDLYSLYLKDVNLLLLGKIKIDYYKEKIDYFGNFKRDDLSGDINLNATKDLLSVYLNSQPFKSLAFLKEFFRLSPIVEEWMYDNVDGDITLKGFYGDFDLKNNELLFDSLKGKALIDNAKVKFHKDVDAIETKNIEVDFEKNTLTFNLNEPKYKNIPMTGSNVVIRNLTSENDGEVEVNIKATAKLDNDVHKILKAYHINIPLEQKSGTTVADLKLIFPYIASKKMTTLGEFDLTNSKIAANKFVFDSKSAKVLLKDTIIDIQNANFKYGSLIDAVASLQLDTKTLKANGNATINRLYVGNKDQEILNVRNYKSPLQLDFNKKVQVDLSSLETSVLVTDLIYVDVKDLSKLYKYSKLLKENSIKSGNISLKIKDENDLNFSANIGGLDYPISRNSKKITALNIDGIVKNQGFEVTSSDKLINVKKQSGKNIDITLKNTDIDLKDTTDSSSNVFPTLNVNLENSKLILKDAQYQLDSANIKLKPDIINFDAKVSSLNLPIKKANKDINSLDLTGSYKKDLTQLYTKNNDLNVIIKKDELSVDLNGYEILYNTEEESSSEYKNFNLTAKNSTIFMNNKYKFLSDALEIRLRENSKFLHLNYKNSDITFKEAENNLVDIFASDVSGDFINSIYGGKKILSGGKFMLLAKGDINNLDGKLIIEDTKVEDLAILNNLLLFIHTSPALINPLLVIPSLVGMATNDGFNLTGYKIVNGSMEFNYSKSKEALKIKKLITVGNGMDFDGYGDIDLKEQTLKSKIKMIFLKDYSSIVGSIPIVNYVLLGDNKRVETEVDVFGPLNNPQISTNLTKDTFSVPLNIAKRILQSPSRLLEFIRGEEDKNTQEPINKPNN